MEKIEIEKPQSYIIHEGVSLVKGNASFAARYKAMVGAVWESIWSTSLDTMTP
jgi:hypothetical protein